MGASRTIARYVVALLHTSSILLIVLGREVVQCECSWRYGSSVVCLFVGEKELLHCGCFFFLPLKRKRWFFPQQWVMLVRGAQEGMLSEQQRTTIVCQWLTQSVSGRKLNSLGDQRVQQVVVPAQSHSYHGLAATPQLPGLLHKVHKLRSRTGSSWVCLLVGNLNVSSSC